MTLEEFCVGSRSVEHIDKFKTAYAKGMERDPENFAPEHTLVEWVQEFELFVGVGGDAEDPINV